MESGSSVSQFQQAMLNPYTPLHQWIMKQQCPEQVSVFLWNSENKQYGFDVKGVLSLNSEAYKAENRRLISSVCLAGNLLLHFWCAHQFLIKGAGYGATGHMGQDQMWNELRGWWQHMRAMREIVTTSEVRGCLNRSPWPMSNSQGGEEGIAIKQWIEGWIGDINATSEPRIAITAGKVDLSQMMYNGTMTHRRRGVVPKVRACLPLKNKDMCWPEKAQFTTESCTHCCDPSKGPYGDENCWKGGRTFEMCCQQDYKGVRCEEHRKEEPGCLDCPSSLSFFCEEEHKFWMIKAWHGLNQTIYAYNDWLNITKNYTARLDEGKNNLTMAANAYNHSAKATVRASARIARLLAVPDKAWVEGEIFARTRQIQDRLNVSMVDLKSNLTDARKNESDALNKVSFAKFRFQGANTTYFGKVNRLDSIAKREDEIYEIVPELEANITNFRQNRTISQVELERLRPSYVNYSTVVAAIDEQLNMTNFALKDVNAALAFVDEDLKDLLDHERASARLRLIANETKEKLNVKANYTAEHKVVSDALATSLRACATANSSREAVNALCSQEVGAEEALTAARGALEGAQRNATKSNGLWRRAKKFDDLYAANISDFTVKQSLHAAALSEELALNATLTDLRAHHKNESELRDFQTLVLTNATQNLTVLSKHMAEVSDEISKSRVQISDLNNELNRSRVALARATREREKFASDLAGSEARLEDRRAELIAAEAVEREALAAVSPIQGELSDVKKSLASEEDVLAGRLRLLAGERSAAAVAVKAAREILDTRRRAQEAAHPWIPTAAWRALDWVSLNAGGGSEDDANFRFVEAAVAAVEKAESAVAKAEEEAEMSRTRIRNFKTKLNELEGRLASAWKATRPARDSAKMRRVVFEASETGVAVISENLKTRESEISRLTISIPAGVSALAETTAKLTNLTESEFPLIQAAVSEAAETKSQAASTLAATVVRVEALELEISSTKQSRDSVPEARTNWETSLREYSAETLRQRFPVIASLEKEAKLSNDSLASESRKSELAAESLNRTITSRRKFLEEISVADVVCANATLHETRTTSWKRKLDEISSDLYWLEKDERIQQEIINKTALENLDQAKYFHRLNLTTRASELKSIIAELGTNLNATETENAVVVGNFLAINRSVTELEISERQSHEKISDLLLELHSFKDERARNADEIRAAQKFFSEAKRNVTFSEEILGNLSNVSLVWESRLNQTSNRKLHAERKLVEAEMRRAKIDVQLNFNSTASEYRTWIGIHLERAAMLNWTRGNVSEQTELLTNATRKVDELYKEYVSTEKYFYQKEQEWKDYERRVADGLEEKLNFVHEL